jgi:hypothetical protein
MLVKRAGLKNWQVFLIIILNGAGRAMEKETIVKVSRIAVERRDVEG